MGATGTELNLDRYVGQFLMFGEPLLYGSRGKRRVMGYQTQDASKAIFADPPHMQVTDRCIVPHTLGLNFFSYFF